MDREVTYTLAIDIPINEETSGLYSENENLIMEIIDDSIHRIESISEKEGFISLERIFRILKMRESPNCPHILFDRLMDYFFHEGNILSLFLDASFDLEPVFSSSKKQKPQKHMRILKPEPEGEQKEESPKEES